MAPKTIYIVRHCDKPLLKINDTGNCTDQGYKRASMLVGLDGKCTTNLNTCNNICQGTYTGGFWKKILGDEKPTALYAAVSKSDSSYLNDKNLINRGITCSNANRCCFLLNPTANYYNIEINNDGGIFCDTEGALLGKYILNQPNNDNGIIIISWEHHDIPNLINSLGVNPPLSDWPDDASNRFDIVFKLDFTNSPTNPTVTILTQDLGLDGDSNTIPDFKNKIIDNNKNTKKIIWYIFLLIIIILYFLLIFLL